MENGLLQGLILKTSKLKKNNFLLHFFEKVNYLLFHKDLIFIDDNDKEKLAMIQALYIFQSETKDLLYNKSFQSDEKLEMFDSFFTALQTFVSELTESSSESLNTIELGEYFVLITRVPEVISDLVIITDKEDIKEVKKEEPIIEFFYCPECGRKCKGQKGLKVHIYRAHSNLKEAILKTVELYKT